MSKVSSKLAASVRKVKGQEDKPAATAPVARETQAPRPVASQKPAPASPHPDRVWPD